MIQLASFGVLLCIVLAAGFAAYLPGALRKDREDEYHLLHGPNDGCVECADK